MTGTTPAGPRSGDRPTTNTQAPTIPDISDLAAWMADKPTHVLAAVSAAIDAAVCDADLGPREALDLRTIAAPLRVAVRRRRTLDRLSAARRALDEAGWGR